MKKVLFSLSLLVTLSMSAQDIILDRMNEVSTTNLMNHVRDLTGEQSTTIGGSTQTITNRNSKYFGGNDLAAQYLKETFESFGGNLTVAYDNYNPGSLGGKNVIATQVGTVNPNNIYVICAHYDTYRSTFSSDSPGASDDASGTAAVLEIARILSQYCTKNTIIYALWDEEEDGLKGSKDYADRAKANGDNILRVLNLDMMGYDGDDNGVFDIDGRNILGTYTMIEELEALLNIYDDAGEPLNGISATTVYPWGTNASDHASFWNAGQDSGHGPGNGYTAVLLGEAWSEGETSTGPNGRTPHYHKGSDYASTLNQSYFTKLTQLCMAYMATYGDVIVVDKSVSQSGDTLTVAEVAAGTTYQWVDCNNANAPIAGETNQSFTPTTVGTYAVEITKDGCVELSDCTVMSVLSTDDVVLEDFSVFPNPLRGKKLTIKVPAFDTASYKIMDLMGRVIEAKEMSATTQIVDFTNVASGAYFVELLVDGKTGVQKIVKE